MKMFSALYSHKRLVTACLSLIIVISIALTLIFGVKGWLTYDVDKDSDDQYSVANDSGEMIEDISLVGKTVTAQYEIDRPFNMFFVDDTYNPNYYFDPDNPDLPLYDVKIVDETGKTVLSKTYRSVNSMGESREIGKYNSKGEHHVYTVTITPKNPGVQDEYVLTKLKISDDLMKFQDKNGNFIECKTPLKIDGKSIDGYQLVAGASYVQLSSNDIAFKWTAMPYVIGAEIVLLIVWSVIRAVITSKNKKSNQNV